MKLAKVVHDRCNEYDNTTYLLVPDDLAEEEFDSACRRASTAYIRDAAAYKYHPTISDPGYSFSAVGYPDDWTIGQAKLDWQEKKAKYEEWKEKRQSARRSFTVYLQAQIPGSADISDCEFETILIWGHQHGMGRIFYGPDPADQDLQGIANQKEEER